MQVLRERARIWGALPMFARRIENFLAWSASVSSRDPPFGLTGKVFGSLVAYPYFAFSV